jgi:hypothetical protein
LAVEVAAPYERPQVAHASQAAPRRTGEIWPASAPGPKIHRKGRNEREALVESNAGTEQDCCAEADAALIARQREAYEAALRASVPRQESVAARDQRMAARGSEDPPPIETGMTADVYRDARRAPEPTAATERGPDPAMAPEPRKRRSWFHPRYPAWWE